jgi:hypothetical protein
MIVKSCEKRKRGDQEAEQKAIEGGQWNMLV